MAAVIIVTITSWRIASSGSWDRTFKYSETKKIKLNVSYNIHYVHNNKKKNPNAFMSILNWTIVKWGVN